MSHVIASRAAAGPLSSAAVQWGLIALAGISLLPPGATVLSVLDQFLTFAKQLRLANAGTVGLHSAGSPGPIVINVPNSHPAASIISGKLSIMFIQASLAAAACWAGYGFLGSLLPQSMQECLPVSRKIFETAVQSLAKGLINVKDVLGEAIGIVDGKVDVLNAKQDDTLDEVRGVKNELDTLKQDVLGVHDSVKRVEMELARASRRQSYTARGVRLLISCVGALMPGNAQLAGELNKFTKSESFDEEGVDTAQGVVAEMQKAAKGKVAREDSPEDVVTPVRKRKSEEGGQMKPQQEAMGESQRSLDEVRALLSGVNMVSPMKSC